MKELQAHPIAENFPLLDQDRLNELAGDIKANGLIYPIVLYEGKILDGRNRYRACMKTGVEPIFSQFSDGNPWNYIWSANGQRRDLIAVQRYLIWERIILGSAEWESKRREIRSEANRKRSEATKEQPRTEDGHWLPGAGPLSTRTRSSKHPERKAKAKASGVNVGAVAKGDRIAQHPDLAGQVIAGTLKPAEALRKIKKGEIKGKIAALPSGKYRVIYADPPWKYNDERQTEDHRESTGALYHYATMSQSELAALEIKSLAAEDSVLFCWATFPLLQEALDTIKAWGFKYKTGFVWDKQAGSFGHYHNAQAELLLLGTRGACTPETDKKEKQVLGLKRLGHSRKPEEFRELIDRLYPRGPRIILFHRGPAPAGWAAWGAETQ